MARLEPSNHLQFTFLYLLYHGFSFSGRWDEAAAGEVDGAGLGKVVVSGAWVGCVVWSSGVAVVAAVLLRGMWVVRRSWSEIR